MRLSYIFIDVHILFAFHPDLKIIRNVISKMLFGRESVKYHPDLKIIRYVISKMLLDGTKINFDFVSFHFLSTVN